MQFFVAVLLFASLLFVAPGTPADELTRAIQKDLLRLGYEPGNIQGELDKDTIVAISRFQAENDLEVTGEPSPRLAEDLRTALENGGSPVRTAEKDEKPERTPEELRAAQQACLQEKAAARQEAQKKKRGFGSLMRAAGRAAGMAGNNEVAAISRDVYNANATAEDLSSAARDLGLSEDEIEESRDP